MMSGMESTARGSDSEKPVTATLMSRQEFMVATKYQIYPQGNCKRQRKKLVRGVNWFSKRFLDKMRKLKLSDSYAVMREKLIRKSMKSKSGSQKPQSRKGFDADGQRLKIFTSLWMNRLTCVCRIGKLSGVQSYEDKIHIAFKAKEDRQVVQEKEDGQIVPEKEVGQVVQEKEDGQVVQEKEGGKVQVAQEDGQVVQEIEGPYVEVIQGKGGEKTILEVDGQVVQEKADKNAILEEEGQVAQEKEGPQIVQEKEGPQIVQEKEDGELVEEHEDGQVVQDNVDRNVSLQEVGHVVQEKEDGNVILEEDRQVVEEKEDGNVIKEEEPDEPVEDFSYWSF